MKKIILSLSKIWLKIINLEQSFFSRMETVVGKLYPKEEKLDLLVLKKREHYS